MKVLEIGKRYFRNTIFNGDTRSVKTNRNILLGLIAKGISIPVSLLIIPLTLSYVSPAEFGVWLTINSIIGWTSFFDIGLGNGLRNKFTVAIAKGDISEGRQLVSTTYLSITVIAFIAALIFFLLNPILNWYKILNIEEQQFRSISSIISAVFVLFMFQLVLKLSSTILVANQESGKASMVNFFISIFTLVGVYFLTKFTAGNLYYLIVLLSFIPVLVHLLTNYYIFRGDYSVYFPSFREFRIAKVREILTLGVKFFILQIGALVFFQTDNIIIGHLFSMEDVAVFNVCFKPFSVIMMVFIIVITPYWSAFTDAFEKKDYEWMRKTLRSLRQIWLLLSLAAVLLYLVSPFIFKIWIGNRMHIPQSLSLAMAIYVITYMWQTIHVFLLNGTGKVRIQLVLFVILGIINIPFAFFLSRYFGVSGVSLANSLLFILMGIVFYIQTRKIVNQTDTGIWGA